MKILYVTTVGSTMSFFIPLIKKLLDEGNSVDIATNTKIKELPDEFYKMKCNIFHLNWKRTPVSMSNFAATRELSEIINREKYDIVHCHTPVAAMCTRIACIGTRKQGTRVFYTAHGFHFYKGAPLKNWILFYLVEWICAHITDVLITINREDFELAKKSMHAKQIVYIPGVGIEIEKYKNINIDKKLKRKEIGVPEDAIILLSVGELNKNKNHQLVIKAISKVEYKDLHYVIAGKGDLKEELQDLAQKKGIAEKVHLLGFREDVAELYKCADMYVLPSLREGLNVSIMEAIASGLPVFCSKIRGNIDMVEKKECLFNPKEIDSFVSVLNYYLNNKSRFDTLEMQKELYKFEAKKIMKEVKSLYEK